MTFCISIRYTIGGYATVFKGATSCIFQNKEKDG